MVSVGEHVVIDMDTRTQPGIEQKLLAVCRSIHVMRAMLGYDYYADNSFEVRMAAPTIVTRFSDFNRLRL
jgi:hypothetical protein